MSNLLHDISLLRYSANSLAGAVGCGKAVVRSHAYAMIAVSEGEEADQLALGEVFGLCFAGSTLGDAVRTVAVDRNLLRHLLAPRPKFPKQLQDREPLKRQSSKGSKEDANRIHARQQNANVTIAARFSIHQNIMQLSLRRRASLQAWESARSIDLLV